MKNLDCNQIKNLYQLKNYRREDKNQKKKKKLNLILKKNLKNFIHFGENT